VKYFNRPRPFMRELNDRKQEKTTATTEFTADFRTSYNSVFAVRFAHQNAFGTSQTRRALFCLG